MAEIRARAETSCRLDASFPAWPFKIKGEVFVYDFVEVFSLEFALTLMKIAESCADEEIFVVGWDDVTGRDDGRYLQRYGAYPGFRVTPDGLAESYWRSMTTNRANTRGAYNIPEVVFDYVAIAGTSQRWAVWGQRGWDVALLVTDEVPDGLPDGIAHNSPNVLTDPGWVIMDHGITRGEWRRLQDNCVLQS
ncbi:MULTISPECIES: hypothetical protein [Microbacterium]|uniref:hypothetical protein n=1 Tax=Microbacterium TaxID=33882 RepID=UPI0027842E82|nr:MULTISPECIES: hypothetical protein [Microbacterium]MDQ1083882.1 hypothetical protein [Microbacterium sp. SORGH_AS_0344]MDQ1170838.1 hypothetical protein [Microbacterium proteolyticum]